MTIDRVVADFFVSLHSTLLTHLAWMVTSLGNEATLCLASVVLLGWCLFRGQHREALTVAIGMAGSAAMTVGVKHLVQRARPGAEFRVPGAGPDQSFSFPSGHTMNTTVFVIVLGAVLWPWLVTRTRRTCVVGMGAVVALTVGASRIYLGYHWFTDVLAGLAIGATWGLLVVWFLCRTGNPDGGLLVNPADQRWQSQKG